MWSLSVEMLEKFGGGAVVTGFGGPCALWFEMVAPSGGHFGFGGRRTFLDLGAVLAGGLPLPGALNSCQDQAGQLAKHL